MKIETLFAAMERAEALRRLESMLAKMSAVDTSPVWLESVAEIEPMKDGES